MNNYQENPDSPPRRRFHRERRGRAACFSRPQKGHRRRRPLYIFEFESSISNINAFSFFLLLLLDCVLVSRDFN
ncbi:hypothetical protein Y032_0263g584 [Ancylostoma ceylanicum]|uniref:Uncharacterized protein n=1 Tax=Ancylostoma ceylanicum TaxID=53326 RepID=A0A016S9R8_9BILA|nr:hypothetical protein Y032_0263g584 [Ancylostoma ceylanicum]